MLEWEKGILSLWFIAHTFSRVCQIYCIKTEIKFNMISGFFFFLVDGLNTRWWYYDILVQEYGLNYLLISLLSLPSLQTQRQFHNKITQEQKSRTITVHPAASLYTTCSLTEGQQHTKKKKGWLWNVSHETELFIKLPHKNKARVRFTWPERLLSINLWGSKPRQNEYYQVIMVTTLWPLP